MTKPLLIAHRGLSCEAPENTLAAFEMAVKAGCGGVETDAHLTTDGKIALIHDENTRRTTGKDGVVEKLTMTELLALDAGDWYDDRFTGQRIPQLWQLLELIKPTGMLINLELKNSICRYPGLEQAVLTELRRFGMTDRIVFSSFNHASMALVKELEPRAETALLYDCVLHEPAAYARLCRADGLHPLHKTVDEALARECRVAGLKLRPWTVNNPAEAERLASYGVDALISDCAHELLA